MALVGVAPAVMKPTALVLNILVAIIGTVRFARAGHFRWGLFWPFALGSIPFAFLGGAVHMPGNWYKAAVGVVLLLSAARLAWAASRGGEPKVRPAPRPAAVASGAGLGLLAGLTGTGGGIFLSPLLLQMRWAGVRQTSAVAAAFILVNSVSGLAGNLLSVRSLPPALPYWILAAAAGGLVGSGLGSRGLSPRALRYTLAAVLLVAGAKLVLGR
jgi:uncharacterized protein